MIDGSMSFMRVYENMESSIAEGLGTLHTCPARTNLAPSVHPKTGSTENVRPCREVALQYLLPPIGRVHWPRRSLPGSPENDACGY